MKKTKKYLKILLLVFLIFKLFLYFYGENSLIIYYNNADFERRIPYEIEIYINGEFIKEVNIGNSSLFKIVGYKRTYLPVNHMKIINKSTGKSDDIYYNEFLSKWISVNIDNDGMFFSRHWIPPLIQ